MSNTETPPTGGRDTGLTSFLRGPRRTIIETLLAHGGQATTPQLGTAVDTSNPHYHIERLIERGLVHKTGEIRTENGEWAKHFRITKDGKDAAESLDSHVGQMVTVAELEQRIEQLEAKPDPAELAETIDRLNKHLDAVESTVETHHGDDSAAW